MNAIFPSQWYKQWFPLTAAIGFLDAPFDDIIEADRLWRASVGKYTFQHLRKPIHHQLTALLPLSAPLTRYLWVKTSSKWTAYFDNFYNGGDPYGPISVLTERLQCQGVIIAYSPQLPQTYGAARFDLYTSAPTSNPHNILRSVAAINDGGRWSWTMHGAPQVFEYTAQYNARQIRNRLSWSLLVQYGQALGIDLYAESFYANEGVVIVNTQIQHVGRTEQIEPYQKRVFNDAR